MKDDAATRLLAALEDVEPGAFCAVGKIAMPPPTLDVEGVGRLPLPLSKAKAEALRRAARPAPYGKGAETLVDPNVRRAWEVDAGRVSLSGEGWDEALAEVVAQVAKELGLGDAQVDAQLYKLLMYEEGGFFLPHRDGEKADGMVATLVVTLPSAHEGGELIVRHDGIRKLIRFGGARRSLELRYAAFYADCEHEVKPVTSGRRLVLTYNLIVARSAEAGGVDVGPAAAVAGVLSHWAREEEKAGTKEPDRRPSRLAVTLDHGYTQAGLSIQALKGPDRARVGLLFEAARRSGCDAFLALVTLHESGMGEEEYRGRRRRWDAGGDGGGPYTMVEVYEETLTAGHLRDADGRAWEVGSLPLLESEVVSDEAMSDEPPDREEYEGYTGNEGMTLDRWYHRAAVVLWPSASRLDVLRGADVDAAVGGLAAMVDAWGAARARSKEKAALGEACRDYARRLIAAWPSRRQGDKKSMWERPDPAPTDASLLDVLEIIGDADLIAAWIQGPFSRDATLDPGAALGDLCDRHGWPKFAEALGNAFEATSRETVERNARLLADWIARKGSKPGRKSACASLAGPLAACLEGLKDPEGRRDWQARVIDMAALLPVMVRILVEQRDADGLDRLVAVVLDQPIGYGLATVQIPALLALEPWLKSRPARPLPALRRWLTAVRDDLQRRAVKVPAAPTDLRRNAAIGCKCDDCLVVVKFLNDPEAASLRLPMAKQRRRHLHSMIDLAKLDLTHATEHHGRPQTLVLTKTQASYDRAAAEHRDDLERLEKIGAMLAWCEGKG